jgi:hypothetical protein
MTVRTVPRWEEPTSLAPAPALAHCDLPDCTQAFVTTAQSRLVSQRNI